MTRQGNDRIPAQQSDKQLLRVATWNTEWRKSNSADAQIIRDRLKQLDPDIVCLTETHFDFLEEWAGYSVAGTQDWGGPTHGTRREVLIWSKYPWENLDQVGSPKLPPGRFVQARTATPMGNIDTIGVVIPYHMSNVSTGSCDKSVWELHGQFLDAFPDIKQPPTPKSILLGDFNQRVPSRWVPRVMRQKLAHTLEDLSLVTCGKLSPLGLPAIDHIAIGTDLRAIEVGAISNLSGSRKVSDHFGVWAELSQAVG